MHFCVYSTSGWLYLYKRQQQPSTYIHMTIVEKNETKADLMFALSKISEAHFAGKMSASDVAFAVKKIYAALAELA
jgi:hypothetical protein